MIINHPLLGPSDSQEFVYLGDASLIDRPDWQARLTAVALAAYRAIGLRGYGRIDMRMLGDEPQILDVNANPDLDVTSVLPVSSRAAGYTYGGMLARILDYAAERRPA